MLLTRSVSFCYRVQSRQQNVKSVYNTHIDVVHYRRQDARRLHETTEDDEYV